MAIIWGQERAAQIKLDAFAMICHPDYFKGHIKTFKD